jgi:exodeoxyribonuclease V alpha subunit
MAQHLSLRLAWHNEGWNGHICKNPKSNIYCVGNQSYPGSAIAENRDLDWESNASVKGCHCSTLDKIPPCAASINAFGTQSIKAEASPPDFFGDDSDSIQFDLAASTACTWPYEAMYGNNVKKNNKFDYQQRLDNAKHFFNELQPNKTLVFYYANKSNPFSTDDNKVYALIGISRLKKLGNIMYYDNVSRENQDKYAGGFVWQMPVTSNYPDEGFAIPYHKYANNEAVLQKLLVIPEQDNNFKYAAKHINDDDALIYVERLINTVEYLISINDTTEDWQNRKSWLQSLLAELWISRGAYPGFASLLDFLDCGELISFYFEQSKLLNGKKTAENIIAFFENRSLKQLSDCNLIYSTLETYRRNWFTKLKTPELRNLAKLLARIAISKNQIAQIIDDKRSQNGLNAPISEILDNLFVLSEQYVGNDAGDELSFHKIDHAVLPTPNLGITELCSKSDWRRLRALMVHELKYESMHSFVSQTTLLNRLNKKLEYFPEWKKEVFNDGFIEYDKNELEKALTFVEKDEMIYVYLNAVFQDERLIEKQIRELLDRPDIQPNKPFTESRWNNELYVKESKLATRATKDYKEAIHGQIQSCSQIFNKPCSIIAGSAGTGKTTIIKAIIKAIKFTSGNTESICLLAPTGKAADRIRQKTQEEATTIHSFLTKNGWLNFNNWTTKRFGGKKCPDYSTYIIDESSMIDLHLMATLFRAIDWNVTKRIILVGDPNQLPPIGKGKVFAETIDFISQYAPESYGKLSVNIRHMDNKVSEKGTGIIDLADLYIKDNIQLSEENNTKSKIEDFVKKIQESDDDVSQDLRIVTWQDANELEFKLAALIEQDIATDQAKDMMQHQIISPYRGELFGTENLNTVLQRVRNGYNIKSKGNLAGITVFDKIIQTTNRANSKAYDSYNMEKKVASKVDIFNGEMGMTRIHNADLKYKNWGAYRYKKFHASFEQKPNEFIEFKSDGDVESNIELGYAISVHKSQGSEFERVYFVLPKSKQTLLSTELLYTGITRAQKHLTVLVEGDFRTLLTMRRPEKSKLRLINSSVFELNPLPEALLDMGSWYEEGKIHSTLAEFLVRSKSEVIIANLLLSHELDSVTYEKPLFAKDGSFYLPDFTLQWRGKTYYWEHLGMLHDAVYKAKWEIKAAWYQKYFPSQLITTQEGTDLSHQTLSIIQKLKRGTL